MNVTADPLAPLHRDIVPIRFGPPLAREPEAAAIGFKAYNLWRMARLGLPVPHALVIGTGHCRDYLADPAGTSAALRAALALPLRDLEAAAGLRFGSSRKPLLVSVRSGAPTSMPGMMQTVLNVGLCDATVHGLLRLTGNPRLVWDSYRRFVQAYAEVVHGCSPAPFDEMLRQHLRRADESDARELDFRALRDAAVASLAIFESQTGQPFPQQPVEQLHAAICAVFASWNSARAREYRRLKGIDDAVGTAVTLQRMVYGNAGGTSGSGVGFTRDPASGDRRLYVDFLFNAQGEDVVSGRHRAEESSSLAALLPDSYEEIERAAMALEQEFRDAQEFEFTVQDGQLFLLQTRTAKRTAWAALRMAVDMAAEGLVKPAEALARLDGIDAANLSLTRVRGGTPLARGVSASAGVATGEIALDARTAQRRKKSGRSVILVREAPSTEDVAGIAACDGLLCVSGGRTSHAAVVARHLEKVCVVGCDGLSIDLTRRHCRIGTREFAEGDMISLDGASGTVHAGAVEVVQERPVAWLATVERWQAESAATASSAGAPTTLSHA
jgi:pyruvate,orthophosphate dikinase